MPLLILTNLSTTTDILKPLPSLHLNVDAPRWFQLMSENKELKMSLNATSQLLDNKPLYYNAADYLLNKSLHGAAKQFYAVVTVLATILSLSALTIGIIVCVSTHHIQKSLLTLALATPTTKVSAHPLITSTFPSTLPIPPPSQEGGWGELLIFSLITAFIISTLLLMIIHGLITLFTCTGVYQSLRLYWHRLFHPQNHSHLLMELSSLNDVVRLPITYLHNAPSRLFFLYGEPCKVMNLVSTCTTVRFMVPVSRGYLY